LHKWQDRVLEKLDEAGVSVPIMSRFKTFHRFKPEFQGKSEQQELLESIWDAKLKRLRVIMDSFDH
jgi:hypothetical protein